MKTLSPEGYKVQAIVMADEKLAKEVVICKMEVGDWFSGERELVPHPRRNEGFLDEEWDLQGNLVEIKIDADWKKGSNEIPRFKDEAYRMMKYKQQNPHVELHAYWEVSHERMGTVNFEAELKTFLSICFKYGIWGHWGFYVKGYNLITDKTDYHDLVDFLIRLDQPSSYVRDEAYIKRSHEEPTILAKMLRQFPGISSEKAIEIADGWYNHYEHYEVALQDFSQPYITNLNRMSVAGETLYDEILNIIGKKKNGEPKKLAMQLKHWLETGDEP